MSIPLSEPTTAGHHAVPEPPRAVAEGRGWAWGGIVTALGGLVVFFAAGPLWPYEESDIIDNAKMVARLDGSAQGWVFVTQLAFTAAALGAVLFGAGLRRRLERQCPAGSLVPTTAYLGMLLVGVMSLVGAGMGTEVFHNLRNADKTDPDTIVGELAQLGTYGWLWAGLVLTAAALVVAAFRQGAVSRWIGVVSVIFGFLALVTQLLPFQYMALFVGVPYLLVLGCAFAFGRRPALD
ncbi:hypothetical protein [Streptomyces aurantiogriseus]|uniref:DUF4386 family protein n=1 Tax=Streptomyces aurantiogriseus TaxID=66870 RepID=A0A918CFY8_9ACTN|nr:hypothetical protein [Streptomyces aurantiogriseus]GGR19364.1 hypothetical protein GCM10010251_39420 [Streptomyces aurantiogriseus]